ncbi:MULTISPECIES: LysR family transcriptional regulator [unclassified Shinella]|jgi:DNA-binding transcriptional LysR family regulator|uniref:LysR family transcriptional regulator n=1 Tax=unclassified Shinella TaxID=2643062 RepID=UPI0004379F28|nr:MULTISPECIES: LysR family transcriptional regulator [unclassified Shinella]EYR81126.1 transcriptional regulator, LysR family [Shinella sp. DD12]KNY14133.1 LysR family transcriptional regulator [Shinella sp. SUS2]KOC74055.1 LysR family transcriptional regulator [Shinella sp. GWS1]MCO5151786.1 LysR family transcriptional regulator [Shinella sp.]MDC7265387.1 LysR family transcriptional regulator [Shinella sp. HY16]
MNLRFVETFVWVARLGSFRAAADRLNATQAAVSNRIASLEAEMGCELFERVPGGVRLSTIGQRAMQPAEELLKAATSFKVAVGSPQNLRATVSIGTIDSIVHAWLPNFIERVKERFPALGLDLNVDTSLAIGREISDRRLDLALLMGPVLTPGLKNIDLGTMECAWVAAPTFRLGGQELRLQDLSAYPVLTFSRNSVPHIWLLRQFEELGVQPPVISNSNSLSAMLRLAQDGIGIALLPVPMVAPMIANGTLEELAITPNFPALKLHAVYADDPENIIPSMLSVIAREASLDTTGITA